MLCISIEEFSERSREVLTELRAGRSLELTRNGKRVAAINPAKPHPTEKQRLASKKALMRILKKGIDLGGVPFTREEMHER